MKTNELMIGNIVEIGGEPQQLRQIARRKVGYCPLGSPNRRYAHISEVKPIPITEELLLRNGFKDCAEPFILEPTRRFKIDLGKYQIFVNNRMDKDYWHIGVVDSAFGIIDVDANITHLHQLQNLLNIMDIKLDFVV